MKEIIPTTDKMSSHEYGKEFRNVYLVILNRILFNNKAVNVQIFKIHCWASSGKLIIATTASSIIPPKMKIAGMIHKLLWIEFHGAFHVASNFSTIASITATIKKKKAHNSSLFIISLVFTSVPSRVIH